MPVIDYNNSWMIYNIFLALIAVGLGYISYVLRIRVIQYILLLFWLLFLPNTIYIFTDLVHLIEQWRHVSLLIRPLLILQYSVYEIVGICTFVLAFSPFEKIITSIDWLKKRKIVTIIIFNFIIAFGMVLGRVERINSWQVFTHPLTVLLSAIHVITSLPLIGLTVLF